MTDPRNLAAGFDECTTVAQETLNDARHRRFVEQFHWGGHEVYRVAQKGDRAKAEVGLKKRLREIEELLADPTLASWESKLEDAAARRVHLSFFEMLDEQARNIAANMRQAGIRFGYFGYMQSSMVIHGSSLDEFLMTTADKSWFPRVAILDEEYRREQAMSIGHNLETMRLFLMVTKSRVWKLED